MDYKPLAATRDAKYDDSNLSTPPGCVASWISASVLSHCPTGPLAGLEARGARGVPQALPDFTGRVYRARSMRSQATSTVASTSHSWNDAH
jgi:hypothetical protein